MVQSEILPVELAKNIRKKRTPALSLRKKRTPALSQDNPSKKLEGN